MEQERLLERSLVNWKICSLSSEFSFLSVSIAAFVLIGSCVSSGSSGSFGCSIEMHGISSLSYVRANLSRSSS